MSIPTTTSLVLLSRLLACGLIVLSALTARSALCAAEAPRPNVLLILSDDIGWGDMRCYNPAGRIPTPNVDRLAREGMRFTHAHTPAALCAPTRYAMLTGNYPWRGREARGTWGFNVPSGILPGQETVANLLKRAGYRTAMFGKSGIGGQHALKSDGSPEFAKPMTDGPRRWGFDYSFIIPRGHQALPHLFLENERPTCAPEKLRSGKATTAFMAQADYSEPDWDHSLVGERLLAAAEKFLDGVVEGNRTAGAPAPFYMHFCTDGAHGPYVPPATLRGVPVRGTSEMTAHTDMVHEADLLLGHLRDILAKRGLLENTLICFTSDNGGIPMERALGHDAVGGLRGMKSNLFEGGHRVPFVVRWPGRVAPGTVRDQTIGAHDIAATVLELAGVAVPEDQCLDAVSLVPVLTGVANDGRPVRRTLLVQSSPGRGPDFDGGIKGGAAAAAAIGTSRAAQASEDAKKGGATKAGKAKAKGNANAKATAKAKAKTKAESTEGNDIASALYEGDWKLAFHPLGQPAALYNLREDPAEERNRIGEPQQAERVKNMIAIRSEILASKRSSRLSANR